MNTIRPVSVMSTVMISLLVDGHIAGYFTLIHVNSAVTHLREKTDPPWGPTDIYSHLLLYPSNRE